MVIMWDKVNNIIVNTDTGAIQYIPTGDTKWRQDHRAMKDVWDDTGSSGIITGGTITEHAPADGTVDVSDMIGVIKTSDSEQGQNIFFAISGVGGKTNVGSLADNAMSWIYVDYNSGTPILRSTTTRSAVLATNQFIVGRVYRTGTAVEVMSSGIYLTNFKRRTFDFLVNQFGYTHASGGDVAEKNITTTGRYITTTQGNFYLGGNLTVSTAKDTTGAGRFSYFYRSATPGVWTEVTAQQQINNTQYDNGSGTLATLSGGRYGVHWVYICSEGDIYVVFGQGDYTLAQAQAAVPPSSLPPYITAWCLLAAKIIIQKSANTYPAFTSVTSGWTTAFPVNFAGNHNDLGGLQGGSGTDYYHLPAPAARGNIISAQGVSQAWANLAFSAPASGYINYLGIANADLEPSWKGLFDASVPTTIAESAAAATGSALVAARRDHTHGAPATYKATAHNILDSTYHGDALTGSVTRGDLIVANSTPKWSRLAIGSAGKILTSDGNDAAWAAETRVLTFIIDGGGSAITTGQKGHLEIPYACTITQVTTLADQSGSIVVDIWKDTYANFPPTVADSICASAKPTLSTAQKAQDATLTGWTKAIAAGDILAFNVDSAATLTRVTISIKVTVP